MCVGEWILTARRIALLQNGPAGLQSRVTEGAGTKSRAVVQSAKPTVCSVSPGSNNDHSTSGLRVVSLPALVLRLHQPEERRYVVG